MTVILVPTDFSTNSKSGVRFAIHWATRQKLKLEFLHVLHILKPTQWTDIYFAKYVAQKENLCRIKFEKFITGIYRQMNVNPGKYTSAIIHGISPDITILDYCRNNAGIDYICISTRGAGKFNKILGTNTGNLITKSGVPVLAVPKTYRVADVKSVLYATDLRNYANEIRKVVAFAQPLKTTIDVIHFKGSEEILLDEIIIEKAFKKELKYGVKLYFEKKDGKHSLIEKLEKEIRIKKPSVVIMFTNQERTFFQTLFVSSKAEELSFHLKTPLLVFNKTS